MDFSLGNRILCLRTTLTCLFLFASASTALGSNPDQCLREPSQDCVFDLAISAAETESNYRFWMLNVLKVAVLQEGLGSPQSSETLDYFFKELPNRSQDLSGISGMLKVGLEYRLWPWLPDAPIGSGRLADYLLATLPALDKKFRNYAENSAVGYLLFAGRNEQVSSLLSRANPDRLLERNLSIARGLVVLNKDEELINLIESIDGEKNRDILRYEQSRFLRHHKDFQRAEWLAKLISSDRTRAEAIAWIASDLAKEGQIDEAMRLVKLLRDNNLDRFRFVASYFATIYALQGNQRQVELLLWSAGGARPDNSKAARGFNPKIQAIADTVNGQTSKALLYLQKHEAEGSYPSVLRCLAEAYIISGNDDLSLFFDHLPDQHLSPGLRVLGAFQAELGDIAGARETFERERDLVVEDNANTDNRLIAFEDLLVERGFVREAVGIAYKRQDSWALSNIAAKIPN